MLHYSIVVALLRKSSLKLWLIRDCNELFILLEAQPDKTTKLVFFGCDCVDNTLDDNVPYIGVVLTNSSLVNNFLAAVTNANWYLSESTAFTHRSPYNH